MLYYLLYKISLSAFSIISSMMIHAFEPDKLHESSGMEKISLIPGQPTVDSIPGAKRMVTFIWEPNRDTTIMLTVPTYQFKNDATGNLLRQLNDSIAKYDDLPWRIMEHNKHVGRDVIYSCYMKYEYFDDIKGVIHGVHGPTAIYSDSPTWTDSMHLEKAGFNTIIQIEPTILANDGAWPALCCFYIEHSGRVCILRIGYGYDFGDINRYAESRPEFIKRFLWIRDYYKTHGFSTKLEFLNE